MTTGTHGRTRPVHEIRAGRFVRVAIWRNRTGHGGEFLAVRLGRIGRPPGHPFAPFTTLPHLRRDELRDAIDALGRAAEWIDREDEAGAPRFPKE